MRLSDIIAAETSAISRFVDLVFGATVFLVACFLALILAGAAIFVFIQIVRMICGKKPL